VRGERVCDESMIDDFFVYVWAILLIFIAIFDAEMHTFQDPTTSSWCHVLWLPDPSQLPSL
jgi:hypothetical protein